MSAKHVAGRMLMAVELLVAFAVLYVAAVTFLSEEWSRTERLVNFVVLTSGSLFLFAVGRITGHGGAASFCRDEASFADWYLQQTMIHGDQWIATALLAVTALMFGLPEQWAVLKVWQMINAALLACWLLASVILQAKIAAALDQDRERGPSVGRGFVYRLSPEILAFARLPWRR